MADRPAAAATSTPRSEITASKPVCTAEDGAARLTRSAAVAFPRPFTELVVIQWAPFTPTLSYISRERLTMSLAALITVALASYALEAEIMSTISVTTLMSGKTT